MGTQGDFCLGLQDCVGRKPMPSSWEACHSCRCQPAILGYRCADYFYICRGHPPQKPPSAPALLDRWHICSSEDTAAI